MILRSLAALSIAMIAVPSSSSANRVQEVRMRLESQHVVIEIAAKEDPGMPTLRTAPGRIKMWIPSIKENARLEVQGDGRAISLVRVRPGVSGSSLVDIHLQSATRIDPSLLAVMTKNHEVVLKIPRILLPGSADPPDSAQRSVDSAEGAEVGPRVETHHADDVENGQPKVDGGRSPDRAPLSSLATARGPLQGKSEGASKLGWMLASVAVSGVALAMMIRSAKRRGGSRGQWSEIQVLGSQRLGPRHQLVLVRALGEDHLLSMNGERTERIASSPASEKTLSISPPSLRLHPERDAEASRDLLAAADARVDKVKSEIGDMARREQHPFGKEFSSFIGRKLSGLDGMASVPPRTSSPAVAGLVKLRREVG